MTIFGVDVSHYQATSAAWWKAAKAAGVSFGIAKATEGTTFIDPKFADNIAWMRAAGVVPGAYHFQRPGNDAGQAQFFDRAVGDPTGMLIGLDVEAKMASVDPPAWCAEYSRLHPGHPLLVYTGRDLWPGGDGAHLGPLWAAGIAPNRYSAALGTLAYIWAHSTPAQPAFAGWGSPTIIQFTDKATVVGIRCDGNVFLGTREQLMPLTTSNPTAGGLHMDTDVKAAFDLLYSVMTGRFTMDTDKDPKTPAANLIQVIEETRAVAGDTKVALDALTKTVADLKAAVASGGGTPASGPVNVTGTLNLTPGA